MSDPVGFPVNVMAIRLFALCLAVCVYLCTISTARPSQATHGNKPVRVFVQGDSSRLPDFVNDCKHEFPEHGLELTLVRSDAGYDYNIVVAQESSLSGAASAVIALDGKGLFVASVVRSGRMSGKGALNSAAKELAKKLATLGGVQ
jgi:hypothetical protein